MSPTTVRVITALGWRYSATRDAYVHRVAQGRVGPVFRVHDVDPYPHAVDDPILVDALVSRRRPRVVLAEHEREPLPRRATVEPRPKIAVEVALTESEPPRVVQVDGRPPQRGVDPAVLRPTGKLVAVRDASAATA